jgi:hypothetical protein
MVFPSANQVALKTAARDTENRFAARWDMLIVARTLLFGPKVPFAMLTPFIRYGVARCVSQFQRGKPPENRQGNQISCSEYFV